jgi:hypothetical protein
MSARLRECEGYTPRTIAYKQRIKRYYARLAQDRAEKRDSEKLGLGEVVGIAKDQGLALDAAQTAQMELDYLTNGSKDGYAMPEKLRGHLSRQERDGLAGFVGAQAEQRYRGHVKGALKAMDERIERIERCTMQTQATVARLAASLAPRGRGIAVLEDADAPEG